MNNNQQHQSGSGSGSGSGLTRYRSAPSSYFASFLTGGDNDAGGFGASDDDFEQLFNPRASSPDTNRIFSNISAKSQLQQQQQLNSQSLPPRNDKRPLVPHQQPLQSNDYSHMNNNNNNNNNNNIMYQNINSDNSYSTTNRLLINSNPMKMEEGGGGNSGLIRHSSSPAGLFANIDFEKEFGGMGNFGAGNSSSSSASRFKNQLDFSSSSMAPISEIGSKVSTIRENNQMDHEEHGNIDGDFVPGFPINTWDIDDNFLTGIDANEDKVFSNDQNVVNEGGKRPTTTLLSHHLSLPKTSAELSAMEKLLQDSVPCKIRAKRGCATHPRSIAERVRRTKISDRMRKLQELVPNMEKQTNTSDMLDLAVDYIKDLQRQVKTLSDSSARCSCSAKEKL